MFEGESNVLDGRIVKDCIKKCTTELIKMDLTEQQFEKILLRSSLLGIVSNERTQKLSDGSNLQIFYTSFDYLMTGHLEKLTNESKCALHSLLADYYNKKIDYRMDICVYPYAGLEHDAEPDQLFNPKRSIHEF